VIPLACDRQGVLDGYFLRRSYAQAFSGKDRSTRNTSITRSILFGLGTLLLSAVSAWGADAPLGRRLMFFEYRSAPNRFVELNAAGKIAREYKPLSIAVIFRVLPTGNVLHAYGGNPTGVVEVNRQGETVWNNISKCRQVLGCERLGDGHTLIAEQGPCQAVEVDAQGKVVHTTKLSTSEQHFHRQFRNVHKLMNGHLLAAHEGEGAVGEYDGPLCQYE
jgi:hypothetical protein